MQGLTISTQQGQFHNFNMYACLSVSFWLYVGIHLDENLKWNEHVDKLFSKVNRSISGL